MLQYLAAVVVLLAGAAQAQCPSQGCPAEQKLVCGSDGVTYINDCVARCQGVGIKTWAPCNEEYPLDRVSMASKDGKKGTLSLAVIKKYDNNGFNYAGPAFSTSFITDAHQVQFGKKVPAAAAAAGNSSSSRGRDAGGGGGRGNAIFFAVEDPTPSTVFAALDKPTYPKATAFMFDPRRKAVYVQRQSLVQKAFQLVETTSALQDADQSADMKGGPGGAGGRQQAGGPAVQPATPGSSGTGSVLGRSDADLMKALTGFMRTGSGRKLMHIIGGDDRTEIGDKVHTWPYTAVGHLQHRKGVCTGVMISNRAVLTAGHCIYSRRRRAWQENLVFIPARHRVNGQFVEPYGRIPYTTATTYSGWVQNSDDKDALQYDLAVVRLSDENIGYKTGWLGLAWDKKGFNGWVTTAGYASDKPRGSLWISRCKVGEKSGDSSRFTYDCDITPGMSGSPVWETRNDGSFVVRAVNTYESCICCSTDCKCCKQWFNGGTGITALHYNNILAWR